MSISVKLVKELIVKAVNYKLNFGINLPLPYALRTDLSQSKLTTFDHYVLIEGDPDIKSLKLLKDRKIVKQLI